MVCCCRSPVYMMFRLFFIVHNEKYLWWILWLFCFCLVFFFWWELFSRCRYSFKVDLKVLFLWDLKVNRFQTLHPNGEDDIQRVLDQKNKNKTKMYWPPCFANSVSQISNNTGSLRHHRGVGHVLLQDHIKAAAQGRTGFQIQTVRIPRSIPSGGLPGTSFPGPPRSSVEWVASARRRPDSAPRCDVNANDTSAVANM